MTARRGADLMIVLMAVMAVSEIVMWVIWMRPISLVAAICTSIVASLAFALRFAE